MTTGFMTDLLVPPIGVRDHVQGPETARVTLVEYGDYECPHCGAAHSIVKSIQAHLSNRLRFSFRNFPLAEIHPHAEQAAEAAEAGGSQGKFWTMHDLLFQNQDALEWQDLILYARQLGLDEQKFSQELLERVYAGRVREDFMSGVRSGVNGTPTFFINGVRYDGSWDGQSLLAALIAAGA